MMIGKTNNFINLIFSKKDMQFDTRKISYHIEVDHKPGSFESEMDFLTSDVENAYERLQYLKGKYQGREMKVTKITETVHSRQITEGELEKLAEHPYSLENS